MQLREECFQQLAAERERILHLRRLSKSASDGKLSVQNALHGLIHGVGTRLQTATTPTTSTSTEIASPDVNSRYAYTTPQQRSNLPREFSLPQHEYEELMASLEASLIEEMLQEEAEYLESIENEQIEEYVALNTNTTVPPEGVLCPLCREKALVQHSGVVLCPAGHLRLDLTTEGLTLNDLQGRLAAHFESHASSCPAFPVFLVDSRSGEDLLCLVCQHCRRFDVII